MAVDACRKPVYYSPDHLDRVRILWGDEHEWKHTRRPGQPPSLVTAQVDLTPLVDGRGSARLRDVRPGRGAEVLRTWPQERGPHFREDVACGVAATTSWRTSISGRSTARLRRKTAGSSIYAGSPWGSGTSTTTSCGP